MVKMNDIIAFIERAMKENFDIRTNISNSVPEYAITIYNFNEDVFCIQYSSYDDSVSISKGCLDMITIEASEMDIALFKVEVLKAHEYSKNKVIEAFNNFFDKDSSRPTTINDLDNEDD